MTTVLLVLLLACSATAVQSSTCEGQAAACSASQGPATGDIHDESVSLLQVAARLAGQQEKAENEDEDKEKDGDAQASLSQIQPGATKSARDEIDHEKRFNSLKQLDEVLRRAFAEGQKAEKQLTKVRHVLNKLGKNLNGFGKDLSGGAAEMAADILGETRHYHELIKGDLAKMTGWLFFALDISNENQALLDDALKQTDPKILLDLLWKAKEEQSQVMKEWFEAEDLLREARSFLRDMHLGDLAELGGAGNQELLQSYKALDTEMANLAKTLNNAVATSDDAMGRFDEAAHEVESDM